MTGVGRRALGLWLGRRGYGPVDALARKLFELRRAGEVVDVVLLLEHEPVITLGRGAKLEHLLAGERRLAQLGVEVFQSDRGGEVTLHAPGQLVCYPIVNLAPDRRDVRRYVRDLMAVMSSLASAHGVRGGEVPELVGLWVDRDRPDRWEGPGGAARLAKIGAIGVRLSRWVTLHGYALNLDLDLSLYDLIVPCGVTQHGVCSLASLTGSAPSAADVSERAFQLLCERIERPPLEFLDASSVSEPALEAYVLGRARLMRSAAATPGAEVAVARD